MVRVNCEHEASINHFSHSHPLQLSNFQAPQQNQINRLITCSACKLKLSDWIYSCTTCNFFLHAKCTKMPKKITHPYHKEHVLTLLSKPPYLSGDFLCDACGKTGDGFVYNCKSCERDIHILCAVQPMARSHNSHPHELKLTFDVPFFQCDICTEMGQNQWLYSCRGCDFTVHSCCVNRSHVNSLSRSVSQHQPCVGVAVNPMNPNPMNLAWNYGAQQGHFVAPNVMNPGLGAYQGQYVTPNLMNPVHGQFGMNQVPQPGYFMQPGLAASMEEHQRMILQQAILQLRGGQNSMQNRVAIDMLQQMLNGGGSSIGSGLTQGVLQGFGGDGGGGEGLLNMMQLLGGGGFGVPGLDIGGLGDLLGGLGGLF